MASVNCLYAAHYSDCEHQLKEVTSGHRLALVYSLCWRGAGVAPSADRITCAANTLQELLSRYAAATPHQSRICWALEHLYSEKSLYTSGFAALKGQDRKIVDMILTATSELQEEEKFEIYLAEATRSVEEYGECTRYGYDRYGYYGTGNDCFDHCGDFEESSQKLKNFVSLTGDIYQTVGDEFVAEDEVLNYPSSKKNDNKRKRYSENSDDIEEEFWGEGTGGECSGPSGNEGATREMWYRKVVLVMWRKADTIRVKCNQDITAGLLHVVNTCATDIFKGRKEAEQVLDVTKGLGKVTWNTVELCSALDMAAAVHDLSICRDVFKVFFLQPNFIRNYSDDLVEKLRLCVSLYTMEAVKGLILELLEASNADNIGYFADMLFDQDVDATMCKSILSKLGPITEAKDSEWQYSWSRYSSTSSPKEINIIKASVKLVDLFHKQGETVFAQLMEAFFLNLKKLASSAQLKICAETIGFMSEKLTKYFKEDKVGSFLTNSFDIVVESNKLMESMEDLEILLNMLLKYKQNGCLEKLAKRTLIHENKQTILNKMLKSIDSTMQINNPDILHLINERVKYLQIATANGPPKFSWHQPDAIVPGHPKVEAFFRSDQETFTYQEFTGIKHARNWARKHSNDAGTKANFQPGGIGQKAYVIVTKARAGFEMQKKSYHGKVVENHRLMACLPQQDNVVRIGIGTAQSDSDGIVIESD